MFRRFSTVTKAPGLMIVMVIAALVGGLTSSVVRASIPSSNGTISACYSSNGTLKVIDAEAGATCAANTTPLSWTTSGGGGATIPTVHDANGQTLGTLLHADTGGVQVYSSSLNRTIDLVGAAAGAGISGSSPIYYASADCSGQGYIDGGYYSNTKTTVFRVTTPQGITTNYIVSDGAQSSTINYASTNWDGNNCFATTGLAAGVFALSTVTLPFTTPIATPVHF